MNYKRIGVDVGGSHVAASLIDIAEMSEKPLAINHKVLDSKDTTSNIVETIGNCINELLGDAAGINSIGIAFPGPFDYDNGISAIAGVGGKFNKTFGVHMAQALQNICGNDKLFHFSNDAHCYAVGANRKYGLKGRRKIFLTLGTGFGSAFMDQEILLDKHEGLPVSGAFYDQPFKDGIADDYFSTRWILQEHEQITGKKTYSVKELARSGMLVADMIFKTFGKNLGAFLLPWLQKFDCDELVIGGNIARAHVLFGPSLFETLQQYPKQIKIIYCENTEECILTGAALIASEKSQTKSTGNLNININSPVEWPVNSNGYFPVKLFGYPIYHTQKQVNIGFDSLAEKISEQNLVVIDGMPGVNWDNFREQLNRSLVLKKKNVFWYDIKTCLKKGAKDFTMSLDSQSESFVSAIEEKQGALIDLFDADKIKLLAMDPKADINIVFGTGAQLWGNKGYLIYVDMSKEQVQVQLSSSRSYFFNVAANSSEEVINKRFLLLDAPLLNQHKTKLLAKIDCVVDGHRTENITWINGADFRQVLKKMWLHSFINDSEEIIEDADHTISNMDWSFDFLHPDRGLVISGNQHLLNLSMEFLVHLKNYHTL